MQLNPDFLDLLGLLNAAGCEYIVVGAHALAVHGLPRFTGDLDIFIRPTPSNAAKVLAAVREFGFSSPDLKEVDFVRPDFVIQLGHPPRRIDILTGISGLGFDEAFNTRLVVQMEDIPVPFLGRESLIKNKRASGRAKDRVDLDALIGQAEKKEGQAE